MRNKFVWGKVLSDEVVVVMSEHDGKKRGKLYDNPIQSPVIAADLSPDPFTAMAHSEKVQRHGIISLRACACAILSSLLLTGISPAFAQGIVAFEFLEKRIRSAEAVTPLTDTLFGDKVSLYNGATEFEVFDIDLPGNNELPVRLGRTWQLLPEPQYLNSNGSSSQATSLGGFGGWNINVPYLYGTFDITYGWNAGGTSNRCSWTVPARTTDNVSPRDILSGPQLHIPGEGDMGLMILSATHPKPSDGRTYVWGTKSDYRGRCIQLGGGKGEGFEFVDPKGTVYRFDVFATRDGGVVEKGSAQGPVTGHRMVYYLMASKVTDRFGNFVNYNYVGNGELASIESSDGRVITTTRSGGRIVTASAGTRTWQYQYGATFEVVNPDQSRWKYQATGNNIPQIQSVADGSGCSNPIITNTAPYALTVTAPSGAVGKFSFAYTTHTISGTPEDGFCILEAWSDHSWEPPQIVAVIGTPDFFSNYALFEKQITGPGMAVQTWTYEYGEPMTGRANFGGPYCDACDKDKPVTVTSPDGTRVVHQFGALWGFNTGDLLATYTLDPQGTIVKSVVNEQVTDQEMGSMPFPAGYLGGSSDDPAVYRIRPVKLTATALGENIPGHPVYVPPPGSPPPEPCPECEPPPPCTPNPVTGACDAPAMEAISANAQSLGSSPDIFVRRVDSFDGFARPRTVTKSSTLGFSRTETTDYHDNFGKWILGQTAKVTCMASIPASVVCDGVGDVITETTFDGVYALPSTQASFGKVQKTLTYDLTSHVDSGQLGTLKTAADGNNNVTTLSSWKRGIPQTIKHPITLESPSGATKSSAVSDDGWITSITDENGYKTCYNYDAMGRVSEIVYPSLAKISPEICDQRTWNKTTQTFQPIDAAEYGIPAGHWKQVISTGNARKEAYFDALWRPLITREYDSTNVSGTQRFQRFAYDENGQVSFASYPGTTDAMDTGTWSIYDALGRPTSVSQDSELGLLTTTTEYLAGFRTRVTPPKGMGAAAAWQTTTSYMAYDQPTTDWPVNVLHPVGAVTNITRDAFGKPLTLRRQDVADSVGVTRTYSYNDYQQLCRSVEPETGATLMGYDAADNLTWSAAGLPSTTACHATGTTAAILSRKASRTYDARNRIQTLSFPDALGNTTQTYTPDGLLASIAAQNGTELVTTIYTYNKRRSPVSERMQWGSVDWGISYTYNGNGHLSSQTNPGGLSVAYAPNALGQPTQAGSYATGVQYYPNGAIKQFNYGNGIVHTMTQNARQLPIRSTDCTLAGTTCATSNRRLDLGYGFDAHGNVNAISDYGLASRQSRAMAYDNLDRLTQTTSAIFGTANYGYSVLDNLTTLNVSGGKKPRNHAYVYDASNRLVNVTTGVGGPSVVGLGYDEQGNVKNKSGVLYNFDLGNRLRSVGGARAASSYVYDGHGRRVRDVTTASKYSLYSQSGQLTCTSNDRSAVQTNYIYLGGSLVAFSEAPISGGVATVKYQHTDALGTPVAVTNASKAFIEKYEYEPYGQMINSKPKDGPGYTGHVQDAATGLTYMQQRYYDPQLGLFLSVDPVTAYSNGDMRFFNRYVYAFNNPYAFKDPDGRATCANTDCSKSYIDATPMAKAGPPAVNGSVGISESAARS